jgi:hypothetical protein
MVDDELGVLDIIDDAWSELYGLAFMEFLDGSRVFIDDDGSPMSERAYYDENGLQVAGELLETALLGTYTTEYIEKALGIMWQAYDSYTGDANDTAIKDAFGGVSKYLESLGVSRSSADTDATSIGLALGKKTVSDLEKTVPQLIQQERAAVEDSLIAAEAFGAESGSLGEILEKIAKGELPNQNGGVVGPNWGKKYFETRLHDTGASSEKAANCARTALNVHALGDKGGSGAQAKGASGAKSAVPIGSWLPMATKALKYLEEVYKSSSSPPPKSNRSVMSTVGGNMINSFLNRANSPGRFVPPNLAPPVPSG